jgi:hypothetical protein
MMAHKSGVFHFADVEVRKREFSIQKAVEVLFVESKTFCALLLLPRRPPAQGVALAPRQ